MGVFDLSEYLCPASGKPLLLSTGENCLSVQCADGWREFRKNALVEEFYVTPTMIGRGSDTSDLYRPGGVYTGTFYTQYHKNADGSLTYGADWAKRFMAEKDVFPRKCTVIVHDYLGNQIKRDDNVQTDLEFVKHHAVYKLPENRTVDDVIELRWAGNERYFYARGYGLVAFQSSNGGVSSYLVGLNAERINPHVYPISRPFRKEIDIVADVINAVRPGVGGVPSTLSKTPAGSVNVREQPTTNTEGKIVGQINKGDEIKAYIDDHSQPGWIFVEKVALVGWISLQNGNVEVTPKALMPAPIPTPKPVPTSIPLPVPGAPQIVTIKLYGATEAQRADFVVDLKAVLSAIAHWSVIPGSDIEVS